MLVTFDELDWTVRKGNQEMIQEQSVSPKFESIDPKADSGAKIRQGQNKELDEKHEEAFGEGLGPDPANNC